MFEIQLAKSKMENEEGMNHLWIKLVQGEQWQASEIQIQLPEGIYRSQNLNGLTENERGHIVVDAPDQDVLLEIYTQTAVPCGEMTIVVILHTAVTIMRRDITIQVVEEDEMHTAEMNEHVVERIKTLRPPSSASNQDDDGSTIIYIQPKKLEKSTSEYSHLEKDYRVDYQT
ncbi:hypothetical protein ACN9MH_04115 [Paenibacillus silvae]|jgi:ATP-dependent Clp protease protease subunit|uniref:hypothetical protein n=1 Tax=Paenibacillus TaxID=44249 RepID=UPI001C116A41|nr:MULTISPECIES: hypothetical protein [Paenibacillus]MBU5354696.1 hypothetical protein [Paenibacillus barcinonensis]MDM5279866.1 hypothetical protein [Paenibacillus silvae]